MFPECVRTLRNINGVKHSENPFLTLQSSSNLNLNLILIIFTPAHHTPYAHVNPRVVDGNESARKTLKSDKRNVVVRIPGREAYWPCVFIYLFI